MRIDEISADNLKQYYRELKEEQAPINSEYKRLPCNRRVQRFLDSGWSLLVTPLASHTNTPYDMSIFIFAHDERTYPGGTSICTRDI